MRAKSGCCIKAASKQVVQGLPPAGPGSCVLRTERPPRRGDPPERRAAWRTGENHTAGGFRFLSAEPVKIPDVTSSPECAVTVNRHAGTHTRTQMHGHVHTHTHVHAQAHSNTHTHGSQDTERKGLLVADEGPSLSEADGPHSHRGA